MSLLNSSTAFFIFKKSLEQSLRLYLERAKCSWNHLERALGYYTDIFWFQIFFRMFVCANRLCRGQRPIHQKCLLKATNCCVFLVRILVWDYCSQLIAHSNYSVDSHRRELFVFDKIFNQNPDQNALDYLASGSSFRRIASLEILTKIFIKILNSYSLASCY